jgi:hypothetical protein
MVVVLPFYTFCGREVGQHIFVGKGINRLGVFRETRVLLRDNEGHWEMLLRGTLSQQSEWTEGLQKV